MLPAGLENLQGYPIHRAASRSMVARENIAALATTTFDSC